MAEDDDEDRHAILEGLEAISEEGELEVVSWEELMKHNTEDDLWCAPMRASPSSSKGIRTGRALVLLGPSSPSSGLFAPAHPPR